MSEEVRNANMAGKDAGKPVDKRIKQSRDIAKWYFGIAIFLVFVSIVGALFFQSREF